MIADATVSRRARARAAGVERRRSVHHSGSGQHQRHVRRRPPHRRPDAAARRRRAVPRIAGAGVPHRHRRRAGRPAGGRRAAAGAAAHAVAQRWPSPRRSCGGSPRPTPRSCWSARPASARRCSPTPSTRARDARASWWRSTAPPSRASWSRASCSATRRARTRPRRGARPAWSSWPTAARCSSTRSATCRRAAVEAAALPAGPAVHAARRRRASSRPTSASSPPPAATALAKGAHVQEAVLGRLGAQPIVLPPLRDRIEDIGRLAAHFLGDPRRRGVRARGLPRPVPARLAAERARAVQGDQRGRGAEPGRARHRPRAPARRGHRDACSSTPRKDVEDTHVDPTPAARLGRIAG